MKKTIFSIYFALLSFLVWGQSISDHNWIFGANSTHIRFNITDDSGSLQANRVGLGIGGAAVATNAFTGDILFYTDGSTVYDANNQVMTNGTGLSGNPSSAQPAVISAVPGTTSQYYIFTNSATPGSPGTISYSIVDMSLPGNSSAPLPPAGQVVVKNQTTLTGVISASAQGMTIISNANCDGFWLIAQNSGTDAYHVVEIDGTGTFNITTFATTGLPMEAAHISYHEGTNKLAVAPENIENNVVILDFDPASGTLSLNSAVLNTGRMVAGNESNYATEWSPSGRFLYISILGEAGIPAELLQYDTSDPASTLESVFSGSLERSYGLKLGPDNMLYHLYQSAAGGAYLLGRITNPDSLSSVVNYEPSPFGIANHNAKNFSQGTTAFDIQLDANINIAGTCANVPTIFSAQLAPGADSVRWDFGDGGTSDELSPVYTYQNGGSMNVTLTAYNQGKPQSFNSNVNITNFSLQIDLVQDTVGCSCEFPVNSSLPECAGASDFMEVTANIQGGTPTSIQWSNGQTGPTLTPDSAGYYYVVVTDVSGCSTYAGVNVREYDVQDQRSGQWYFGQNAGINFNTSPLPPEALDDSNMAAPEGSSSISNRNGELIFYTDGDKVWDKNHVEIASGIGGDPGSTQSALIVPFPGDETLFYIFTTQEIYGSGTYEMKYSIFDVKQRNGDGDIILDNQLLFTKSTERVASRNNWVVAHEYGNSLFRAYLLTTDGISNAVISDAGSVHSLSVPENGQGYMKFSSTGKLAVALSDPGSYNYVELFDFVDSTGVVSNFQQLNLNEPSGQVYGIEFSPGSNKLFATISGGNSIIKEYFIDSLGTAFYMQDINVAETLGAIQIAPTGQLMVAVDGSSTLGTIFAQEDTTINSTYSPFGFQLAGGTSSGMGLPSFVQNIAVGPQTPSISAVGLCFGDVTTFVATGTDIIDNFVWNFGDGASFSGAEASHTYAAPGVYNVSVQITNRCGLNTTLNTTVTIKDNPTPPTIPLAINICSGPVTLTAADPGDPQFSEYTYLWSTGETTNSITVEQQQIVSVFITNSVGCTAYGETLVAENRPYVDFGEDQTVCQNQTVLPLDAQNIGNQYSWTINGTFSGTGQTQSVDTSLPGDYTYEVAVTDPITGCVITEDITYTVNALPIYTVTPTPSPGCNQNNGTITIDFLSEGSFTYIINGPVGLRTNINQLVPAGGSLTVSETLLPIGTYFVSIRDEVSNCIITNQVIIQDAGTTMVITPTAQPGCDQLEISVDIQDGTYNGVSGFNYILTNLDNATVITNSSPIMGEPIITDPSIPGNYTVSIEDIADNCTVTSLPFLVVQPNQATLTIDPIDECANPIVMSATTDAPTPLFTWTGPNGYSNTGASVNPSETGWYYLKVEDTNLARCPQTDSVYVNVNYFEPTISVIGDPCQGSVMLDAQPAGLRYSYTWNGPTSIGGQQTVLGPAESGTYTVTIRDTYTGCTKTSPEVSVNIIEPLSLTVSSEFACTDGVPFTITATASPDVTFKWYRNGTLLEDSLLNSIFTTLDGFYTVEIEKEGCTLSVDHPKVLAPYSDPDLPNRVSICDDPDNPDPASAVYLFEPASSFIDYEWKLDGNVVSTDPTYLAQQSGNYSLKAINEYGCEAVNTTKIITECNPLINAPTAFSPNGNGENEEFYIYSTFVDDDFEVQIFNRWGELVYQSNDRNFRWNGRYNNAGELLPGGTYAYVMRYVSIYQPEKGKQEKRGGVVLLR